MVMTAAESAATAAKTGIPLQNEPRCFPESQYALFSGMKEKRIREVFLHHRRSMTTRSKRPSPSPRARKKRKEERYESS